MLQGDNLKNLTKSFVDIIYCFLNGIIIIMDIDYSSSLSYKYVVRSSLYNNINTYNEFVGYHSFKSILSSYHKLCNNEKLNHIESI